MSLVGKECTFKYGFGWITGTIIAESRRHVWADWGSSREGRYVERVKKRNMRIVEEPSVTLDNIARMKERGY